MSGGRKRSVCGPVKLRSSPASRPLSTTSGALASASKSTATMRPRPRTCSTCGNAAKHSRMYAPTCSTCSAMPPSDSSRTVARAAATARQLPPNVEPWSPGANEAATSSRAAHMPMGNPEAMPLAMVTTSGVMPKCWKPKGWVPQRNMPHWISSHMSSAPRSSVRRRAVCRNSAVQGCTPLSPCTHSTMTAQMASPCASNRASSAATSLMGVRAKPSGKGRNASCFAGWAVAASVASVRPWKLASSVTMMRGAASRAAATVASSAPSASARAAARFLACKRASLNAHSFASAPELAKKLRHGVRSASGTHAFSRSDTARATSPRCSM